MYVQDARSALNYCLELGVNACGYTTGVFTHGENIGWQPTKNINVWGSEVGIMSILKANISRLGLPYTPTVLHPRDLQLIPSLVDNSQNAWIIVSGKQNTDKMGHAMGIEKTLSNSIYLWDTAFSLGELSKVDSQEVLKRTLRYFSNRYAYFIRF